MHVFFNSIDPYTPHSAFYSLCRCSSCCPSSSAAHRLPFALLPLLLPLPLLLLMMILWQWLLVVLPWQWPLHRGNGSSCYYRCCCCRCCCACCDLLAHAAAAAVFTLGVMRATLLG